MIPGEEKEIQSRNDWELLNYLCIVSETIGYLHKEHNYKESEDYKKRQAVAKEEIHRRLVR